MITNQCLHNVFPFICWRQVFLPKPSGNISLRTKFFLDKDHSFRGTTGQTEQNKLLGSFLLWNKKLCIWCNRICYSKLQKRTTATIFKAACSVSKTQVTEMSIQESQANDLDSYLPVWHQKIAMLHGPCYGNHWPVNCTLRRVHKEPS